MPTVDRIAALAFGAVAKAIPDAVHAATLNGAAAGRVVQAEKAAPGTFPAKRIKDSTLTIYCEGFTPADGDTVSYAGSDYLVFWVHDIAASGGLIKAAIMPTAGWLATTVQFQRKVRTSNGRGGFTEAWPEISGAATAAYVVAMTGGERIASDRVEAHSGWRLVCPYFAGLTEADAVLINSRRHNIRFVDDIERRGVWLQVDMDLGAAT